MATMSPLKITGAPGSTVQSSIWDGLNPHLIARLWKLKKEDGEWVQDRSANLFEAALTEASLEVALNWQSPFENSGTESQAPTVAAMLQTGAFQPLIAAVTDNGQRFAEVHQKANSALTSFEGRTGITKMNSTQVFNGMQPIKITGTLILRAWSDPVREVQDPLDLFMSWILPQELSKDGSVIARSINTAQGEDGMVELLMPSLAPVPVSMRYKRWLFKNMVIESATLPLNSPITQDGYFTEMRIPFTLCSMTAIDVQDWKQVTAL